MNTHVMLRSDAASEWLGITVHRADPGHAVISMRVREEMLNGFAIAHGGMIFALADSCFAMTCNDPSGDNGTITVAQGVDINFISSAQAGETLTATGHHIVSTGRSGICDITVTADTDERLVAVFRGRCRTIPRTTKG